MILPQADRSILENAFLGLLVPSGTAALILVLTTRLGRERSTRTLGSPLALGLSFAAGYAVTQGWPPLPPEIGIKQWLFYAGLFGGLYGAYEALSERRSLVTRMVIAVAAPLLFLQFMREHHWTTVASVLWTAGLAAALFLTWQALETLAERRGGFPLPLALGITSALAGEALHFSGSTTLGQLAGALATALVACAVLGFLRPDSRLAPGGLAPFVLLHSGLVWGGRFASELTFPGFALLTVAPLLAWTGELVPPARSRWRLALTLLLPALAASVAVLLERGATAEPYG